MKKNFKKYNLSKPDWIKVKVPATNNKVKKLKKILIENQLKTVCEEASCPNITECFNNYTATFMILGNICTRKCPFCNVKKGKPTQIFNDEPYRLFKTIKKMKIKYVVITSVTRDDLRDGGASHFSNCIKYIRNLKNIKIEILVPDFVKCQKKAIKAISYYPPDVFNHNIENVPRLYNLIRPRANYYLSLRLLLNFKNCFPTIPTKSGLMLGLGEKKKEVLSVMRDLRNHGVNILTLGQYLQPSPFHLPVKRYLNIAEFKDLKKEALSIGFERVYSGPLVRSSYHASIQSNIYF